MAESSAAPQLSVVAPCYREAEGLAEFYRRVGAACRGTGRTYEIILVDDGSPDATWEVIRTLAAGDTAVRGLRLARNFGHQAALTAGLQAAGGSYILMIDADLQDPPELLGPMLARLEEAEADVVYGQRRQREGETWFKRATAWTFYRVLNVLSDVPIPMDTGDFRLVTRRALEAFNLLGEQSRFVRGMVAWIGYKQVAFEYVRASRHAGETSYPLRKMARFAADALTSFSIRPLRLAAYLGMLCGGMSLLVVVYSLVQWARGHVVQGWTSLVVVTLLIGAMQLLVLGIIGEYLGRLFLETKRRPLFTVRDRVGG